MPNGVHKLEGLLEAAFAGIVTNGVLVAALVAARILFVRGRFDARLASVIAFAFVALADFMLLPEDRMEENRFATPFYPLYYARRSRSSTSRSMFPRSGERDSPSARSSRACSSRARPTSPGARSSSPAPRASASSTFVARSRSASTATQRRFISRPRRPARCVERVGPSPRRRRDAPLVTPAGRRPRGALRRAHRAHALPRNPPPRGSTSSARFARRSSTRQTSGQRRRRSKKTRASRPTTPPSTPTRRTEDPPSDGHAAGLFVRRDALGAAGDDASLQTLRGESHVRLGFLPPPRDSLLLRWLDATSLVPAEYRARLAMILREKPAETSPREAP